MTPDDPARDLGTAKRYLAEIAVMAGKAAASSNPLEVALGVALLRRQGEARPRRANETYVLECGCGNTIEIPTTGPHYCPHCGVGLDIGWGALMQ